jgi:Tol biopolymer transport system component
MHAILLPLALTLAQPADDWKAAESAHLKNVKQVTDGFVRAGEGYFSPDGKHVIFQAEEKDTGNPFYQIFVQELSTGKVRRVSPGLGRTTCSYFRPDGKHIIYTAADHSDPMARPNYDLYWMNLDTGKITRITYAPGQDVLPVFSPDYTKVMWTSSRDGRSPTQLYLADFTPPKD